MEYGDDGQEEIELNYGDEMNHINYDLESQLIRPISKKDLHNVFNQYKMKVAEDDDYPSINQQLKRDIKPTYQRLYEDATRGRAPLSKKYVEEVDHHFNRGGLSRKISKSNILADKSTKYLREGYGSEIDLNRDKSENIFEARKYLRRVIVTFRGLKKEKLWK